MHTDWLELNTCVLYNCTVSAAQVNSLDGENLA